MQLSNTTNNPFTATPHVVLPNQTPICAERLARGRLGVYAGLFLALRMKHPPTAAHCLRVSLACSKWAAWRNMPEDERELLEVAALLHDVGKIGIPDRVLQKATRLDGTEVTMMEMTCSMGMEMLAGAGASRLLLGIIEQARQKYQEAQLIPARMMSIADAFDSMTTEQVFRRAMSQDRAIAELCTHAGAQFDPALVREFAEMVATPRSELDSELASRWMAKFAANSTSGFNDSSVPVSSGAVQNLLDRVFHNRLLESLGDAAIYLDSSGQVLHWNRAAEKLTGRSAASTVNRAWAVELVGLVDGDGQPLIGDRCPLRQMMVSHSPVTVRANIARGNGKLLQVQYTVLPVVTDDREFAGIIILIRDASTQANLEERVQTLNVIASCDPLTGVANRTALNQRLALVLEEAQTTGRRSSVIICDIDFFKRINDTHGHQAGDAALKTFAQLLGDGMHEEDMVARYGGEEFVVVCCGYDNPSATMRAEKTRKLVEKTPIPALGGNAMTASFGVTEIQQGDNAETVLARADRALLKAKKSGRNRVIQTGTGWDDSQPEPTDRRTEPETKLEQPASWLNWFRSEHVEEKRDFLSLIPLEISIEKLKGFIADHRGEIVTAEADFVCVRVDCQNHEAVRRNGERPAVVQLDVRVERVQVPTKLKTYQQCTRFRVTAKTVKARDRRAAVIRGQITQIFQSFQTYLGAQIVDDQLASQIIEPRA